MSEKISSNLKNEEDEGAIILVLTPEEYEMFRVSCVDLLDYYETGRGRAKKIKKVLEKLEEAKK